jgi:hypothetical protein
LRRHVANVNKTSEGRPFAVEIEHRPAIKPSASLNILSSYSSRFERLLKCVIDAPDSPG